MPTYGPIWEEDGYVRVTSERLKRSETLLELLGVSQQDTVMALEEMLDTHRSPAYVVQVRHEAEALARVRNEELAPKLSGLLAADEIFLHEQPILGVVHPASQYLASLKLSKQRDGETWGYELLAAPCPHPFGHNCAQEVCTAECAHGRGNPFFAIAQKSL